MSKRPSNFKLNEQNKRTKTEYVNARDSQGYTILHKAVLNNSVEHVAHLVSLGVDLTVPVLLNNPKEPAFLEAQDDENYVFRGDYRYQHNDNVMHLAMRKGFVEMSRFLAMMNRELFNIKNYNLLTPLDAAAGAGQLEVIKFFFEEIKPAYGDSYKEDAALGFAVTEGRVQVAEFLLDNGYSPNTKAEALDNRPPLIFATKTQQANIMELLLKHGADVNYHYNDNFITHPILDEYIEGVEVLLSYGASLKDWDCESSISAVNYYDSNPEISSMIKSAILIDIACGEEELEIEVGEDLPKLAITYNKPEVFFKRILHKILKPGFTSKEAICHKSEEIAQKMQDFSVKYNKDLNIFSDFLTGFKNDMGQLEVNEGRIPSLFKHCYKALKESGKWNELMKNLAHYVTTENNIAFLDSNYIHRAKALKLSKASPPKINIDLAKKINAIMAQESLLEDMGVQLKPDDQLTEANMLGDMSFKQNDEPTA